MIFPGLCSVTFRKLTPQQIIDLVVQAGLQAIEWGGDVHVSHGDVETARRVRDLTLSAGLKISSYGSYYCAGGVDVSFADALRSAEALGTKTIRVWAGSMGSEEAGQEIFSTVVADLKKTSAIAADHGMSLALEFHDGTLTDSNEAALRLLEAVPEVSIIWQPKTRFEVVYRREGLKKLLPRLSNLHVFQWEPDFGRLPLANGRGEWTEYLALAKTLPGDRFALLEFVVDDSPEAFLKDAASLLSLLS